MGSSKTHWRQITDLVFDVSGSLIKIQVKSAWLDKPSTNYVVDNRRTKTNRRLMVRKVYAEANFDFACCYLQEIEVFYIIPSSDFIRFGSEIHFAETDKRQRKPRSAQFREAWMLILQRAAQEEIRVCSPVKVGEALSGGNPEPSSSNGEGVET